MNKNVFLLLLGFAIVPAGCTMAPKYTRPKAPVPAEWPNGAAYQAGQLSPSTSAVTNAPEVSQLRWQEFFSDEKLRQVIGMALTNNRDLRIATLNVERSRAMYGIQRAELLPAVNATGSATKQRIPANVEGFPEPMTIENYGVNLGVASWEIDFFGRIRSLKDEALQEYLATDQACRSAQILLISSVADAYLTLAADQENLKLAETTLAAQRSTYDMIKRRYNLGLVPELNLHQAEMQVDAALGDAARYTQLVAQDKNALNLLLGVPAPDELLPAELSGVTPPKEISPGLSSEVLLRRPDVLQAEELLKAANADIGAARAAFFPQISLTAAIGTSSSELSGLFKAGSGAWSYGPQIVMPVFDARTWSAHKAAKVQREIAVTQYEKAIQSAFREVADALATRGTVDQQVAAQQSLVNAATETHRLSVSRYDKGIDSYLTVLDAQRSLYAAQQGLVSLRLAKLANQVQLYAVLGGGWQNGPSPAPTAMSGSPQPHHNN
jgi:multidrug efflux system outer membrane protein